MIYIQIVCRLCCLAMFAGACLRTSGGRADELAENSHLWGLVSLATQAPTNLASKFSLNQDDVEVYVGRFCYFPSGLGDYVGWGMAIYNSCSNAFKIVDVPSNVTAIALHYGPFDLRDLPAAANVKYFLAECVDLNVGVDGVCKRFPGLEMLTLDVHRQQGILQVLDSLKSWKGLKWLGIRHNGSSPGDLVRTLMSEFPCLEGLNVYGSCDVGDVTKGKSGNGKRRTIYLSQCLETNTTDVVELPDLGECASVEIRMSSPKVRPVEIRLQANAKKLHMVDISSSNVIPSGEMNLIDNGFIMYDIRVRLGETESVSSHR